MKVYKDEPISRLEFWGGAKETVKYLTRSELYTIESILEEQYPEGLSETELNNLFWFGRDTIAEWLGYSDFEDMVGA